MTDVSLTPNEQAGTDACFCYCHRLSHFAGQCTECRQYGLHQPVKKASPSSVTDAWERFHANTPPHSELAQETTPSKADIREALVMLSMTYYDDPGGEVPTVDEVLELITTTLTQHNEALLAALPRKQEIVLQQTKLTDYQTGYNKAIDQVTAIIKRAGITGSGK